MCMRRFRNHVILAVLAFASAVDPALACPARPVPPVSAAASPFNGRFNSLLALDKDAEPDASAVRWRSLADAARGDPAAPREILARSLAWLAWTQGSTAEAEKAGATATEAEQVVAAAGLQGAPFNAEVLAIVAMTETVDGKWDDAERHATTSLALAQQHFGDDSAEAGFAYFAAGSLANARGRLVEAEQAYGRATDRMVKCLTQADSLVVDVMSSHAATLDAVGRAEEALSANERAADWALINLPDNSTATTLALGNLAVSLRNAGRRSEADAILRRVLDRQARYEPTNWFSRATQLSNYATTIYGEGRIADAEALWLQARAWHLKAHDMSDPATPAFPLRFAADAAEARGDLKLALARRREAIAALEPVVPADHPALALARIEQAGTLSRMGLARDALSQAIAPIAIVRAKLVPDSIRRIGAEITFARITARADSAAAGYALVEPLAQQLELKLLDTSTARGDLVRYGPVLSAAFATIADLAFAAQHDDAAFRAVQLANLSDIVLVSTDLAARAASGQPAAAELTRALQDHIRDRQTLDKQRSFATSETQSVEAARLQMAIAANDTAIAGLSRDLDRIFPEYRALGRPTPLPLADVQATLAAGQILLAPLPVDDGTLAIVVTRDGLVWQKTPLGRPAINALAARVRAAVAAVPSATGGVAPFDAAAAAALYRAMVPAAAAASFKHHSSLLYYASGPLAAIPPALLIETAPRGAARQPTAWLVRTHNITVVPTLALAAARAIEIAAASNTHFLGIGAPALGTAQQASARGLPFRSGEVDVAALRDLPALPGAAAELRDMRAVLGDRDSVVLTGADASETRIKAMPLQGFGIIAIATHGLVGGDFPGLTEPALVLMPPRASTPNDDGMLTATEISSLHLDADWVILSACNSAGGLGAGSPTYGGLAAAFIRAGARSLLVSHWPVRDDAAERLTVATVRNASGGAPRAVALQQAMLTLMADRRVPNAAHPAIWAPFVLIGR